MRRFKSAGQAQRFLSLHGVVQNLFRVGRHLLRSTNPSKEELLTAVLEKYMSMLGPQILEPAYEEASDPIERIFAILNGYRKLL